MVDLKARKFLGEIETPGCAQVTATANRQFFSMCADGSMLTVQFDDSGKETAKKQSKPLFDPNTDPMFDQPAVAGDKAYFISYHGNVLPVDFSGPEAAAQPSWSMLDAADTAQKWRPGGWQTVSYQPKSGLLYALMHQGGEWTHKQFGTEVWVFNAQTHKRVAAHQAEDARLFDHGEQRREADSVRHVTASLQARNLLGARRQIPRRV